MAEYWYDEAGISRIEENDLAEVIWNWFSICPKILLGFSCILQVDSMNVEASFHSMIDPF